MRQRQGVPPLPRCSRRSEPVISRSDPRAEPRAAVGPARSEREELIQQLIDVSREVRLLAAVTPSNWQQQLELMMMRAARGQIARPSFSYTRSASMRPELLRLDSIRTKAAKLGGDGQAIADAAAERHLEATLIDAVNTRAFPTIAARRYTSSAEQDAKALSWASSPPSDSRADTNAPREPEFLTADLREPLALVNVLRASIAERDLPVRVEVRADLVPLAATGDGVVYVTSSRRITHRDACRTALHELDGHVVPLLARKAKGLEGFRRAGEADREEGLSIRIEERAGYLDARRRHELALRHVAATLAHQSTPFVDVVTRLCELGAPLPTSVLIAARALRGGGLGRERVYLPAYFTAP